MRRRFNVDLLPTKPPEKMHRYGSNIGSPFNRWFRTKTKEANVKNKAFAALIGEPYSTIMTWRYRCDPRVWGQCRIARGFEELGLGDYSDLRDQIKRLCRDKKRI